MEKEKSLFGFVIYPGFTGLDLIGPHEVLTRCDGARCILIAKNLETVISEHNIRILPDETFKTCSKLDVLIVPGGPGQTQAMEDSELINFIMEQSAQAKLTTSVCTGALLLAKAGILGGRPATTHWLAMEELARLGGLPRRERIVKDGKVMTGAGVSAGIDMALAIVADLYGPEEAQRIQLMIEYDPQPPFDSGSPEKAQKILVDQLKRKSRFYHG